MIFSGVGFCRMLFHFITQHPHRLNGAARVVQPFHSYCFVFSGRRQMLTHSLQITIACFANFAIFVNLQFAFCLLLLKEVSNNSFSGIHYTCHRTISTFDFGIVYFFLELIAPRVVRGSTQNLKFTTRRNVRKYLNQILPSISKSLEFDRRYVRE